MRVGLFSDYYFSKGDGTAIATRISREGLAEAGHRPVVFCPRLANHPKEAGVVSYRSSPGWLYPGLRLCWPFGHKNLATVSKYKLNIIHLETPIFVGLFGLWAARRLRIPSVMTVHLDMDFMGGYIFRLPALAGMAILATAVSGRLDSSFWRLFWPRRIDKTKRRSEDFAWRAMAFTASRTDLVIAPSQKNYNQLIKYVSPSKVRLVPNGIDLPKTKLTKDTARTQLGLRLKDFVVIVTARHVKEKRVDMAIKGFASFAKDRPDAKLLILNYGPLTSRLKHLADRSGVDSKIIFVGLVENAKVFNYLRAANVFVNTSLREVISLGILEAAASSLPLILCDERLNEPLEDGRNGYLVKSEAELAARLGNLYKDQRLLRRLSEASRKRGLLYGVASHTRALVSVYKELSVQD